MDKNLIGRGASFPFNRSDTGGLKYTEELTRINQSLFIIFETRKGSRLMMPEFGSNLYKYRFDPLDKVLMERIKYTIMEDIKRWEPRISVIDIGFLADEHAIDNSILYVSISYKLKNSDVEGNYVYPYRTETYDTVGISYN